MAATQSAESTTYEEYVVQQPDTASKVMRYLILFLVVSILCLLVYALVVGLFAPPAPRTLLESSLARAQAAVKKSPGNGKAWAALARALYAGGEESEAWDAIAQARKRVKDRSILYVNNSELDFLLTEGKDKQVLKRADEFLKVEARYQLEEKATNLQKNIRVPDQVSDNTDAARLFVLKAAAQGNLGQWKEAAKTLDQVLQLNDTAADVITLRGWARLRSGNKAGAAVDFKRALLFLPSDPSATNGLKAAQETSKTK